MKDPQPCPICSGPGHRDRSFSPANRYGLTPLCLDSRCLACGWFYTSAAAHACREVDSIFLDLETLIEALTFGWWSDAADAHRRLLEVCA